MLLYISALYQCGGSYKLFSSKYVISGGVRMDLPMSKILIVLTSHSLLGQSGNKTGVWLDEFTTPYYIFKDAGVDVTLVTPKGGVAPIDPRSVEEPMQTDSTKRYDADDELQFHLSATLTFGDINAADFDGVFYPGGYGLLWDLTNNQASISLIESFLAYNKPVATVCHSTAVLLNIETATNEPHIKGKVLTGFSNVEEHAQALTDIVPFLLEDELRRKGAIFEKASKWQPFVIEDGLFITGQNPASSALVAEKLLLRKQ